MGVDLEAQLADPSGQLAGREVGGVGEHLVDEPAGGEGVEVFDAVDDHSGFGPVEVAGVHRCPDGRQPLGHVEGQVDVGLGLAAGFLEPLESTSIHLIQRGVLRLMQMFPFSGINDSEREEFNRQMDAEFRYVRDFIILHYHVTERTDSEFWRRCRDMDIPDSLQHRLDLFRDTGLVFEAEKDIFRENSWVQVMMGQGIEPKSYHAIVDMMSEQELGQFMQIQRRRIDVLLNQLPGHRDFINRYCPTAAT